MKYVLWALLLYLGWRWYLSKSAKSSSPSQEASAANEHSSQAESSTEKMVSCAQCGIHLPLSEAVLGTDTLHFCSEAHRLHHSGG